MNIKVLTPCEKVLRDERSGPSLIATFQEIQVGVPEGQEVPGNAVVPKEWAIFALWHVAESDALSNARQWTEVLWPDGSQFVKQPLDVKIEKPDWMMNTVQFQGFPMGQTGRLTIRVWIDINGKTATEIAETWITVKHQIVIVPKTDVVTP
jgi:hypothetical protein